MKRGLLHGLYFMNSDEIDPKVWGIFSDMMVQQKEVRHVAEIVSSAVNGNIDIDRPFNLYGYDMAVELGKNKAKKAKAKFKKSIDFFADGRDREEGMEGDITIEALSYRVNALDAAKDEYEDLFDNAELCSAVENIKALQEDIMLEYNVDIITLLRRGLEQVPEAVKTLADICRDNLCIAAQIKTVLQSGKFDELFPIGA